MGGGRERERERNERECREEERNERVEGASRKHSVMQVYKTHGSAL